MRRLKQISILGISLLVSGALAVGASALQYQSDEVPLVFNFATTMTVTLSGDSLVIDDLSPNTSKNSNVVDITVVTNDASGYTLRATAGSESNASTNLVANDGTFSMIGDGVTALTTGEWGYTINGGTTFGSLPLYTATPKVVNSSSAPTDATTGKTSFQIGAYATPSQAQGDYTNVINFVAVTNTVSPEETNMQDATAASLASLMPNVGDTANLVDARDGRVYEIGKLMSDGSAKYWMMENLRLGETALTADLTSTNTNLTNTVTAATFNGWKKTSGTGTYTAAEYINQSGSDSYGNYYGTLYNYCAASAGTICADSNSSDATADICPKGWRLPTGGASGEFQALATAYSISGDAAGSTTLQQTLKFPLAGYFYSAAPYNQGSNGRYWSSTYSSSTDMYRLSFGTSNVYPQDNDNRDGGFSVRCVYGG